MSLFKHLDSVRVEYFNDADTTSFSLLTIQFLFYDFLALRRKSNASLSVSLQFDQKSSFTTDATGILWLPLSTTLS